MVSKYVVMAVIKGKYGIKHFNQVETASSALAKEKELYFMKKTDNVKIEEINDIDINLVLKKKYYVQYMPSIEKDNDSSTCSDYNNTKLLRSCSL